MCSNANETQRALFDNLFLSLTTIQSDISLRGWGIFFSDFQIFHTHFVYEMFLCLFVNETRRYFVEGVGHIVLFRLNIQIFSSAYVILEHSLAIA